MDLITDPDRLVVFLSGLEGESNSAERRHSPLDDDTNDKNAHRLYRTALVLDALARLLVHDNDGRGQVFAVALVPPSLTRELAHVILSENSEVTEVAKNHARVILEGLYAARQLVDNQFPGGDSPPPKLLLPPFIPLDSEDAAQRKLANIETAIVRHSWSKMAKRFRKANRHLAFFEVSAAILAPDQPERLSSLKAEHGWPSDAGFLKEFDRLRRVLQALHEELSKSVEDGQVQRVRARLALVNASTKALKASMPKVLDMCAAYHPAVSAKPTPRIDFNHWIDKVLSTHADYLQLRRVVCSPTLHNVLTEQIEITSTVQEPEPADALITTDELRDALFGNVNVSDKVLGEYLGKRFKKKKDGRVRVPGRVHCECSVLAQLDKMWRAGDTIIPYVGVSKLSCSVCSEYFAAYRKVTEHDVKTRGTHDTLHPWRCPQLEDKIANEKVRKKLSARLRALLKGEVETFARHDSTSSVTSLSTTASDEFSGPLDESARDALEELADL